MLKTQPWTSIGLSIITSRGDSVLALATTGHPRQVGRPCTGGFRSIQGSGSGCEENARANADAAKSTPRKG